MKYLILLLDGMADYPLEELNGKTPMEAAKKPNIDALAKHSMVGLCKTVAEGLKPGSDVANLSVMGYDPKVCYSGRSPLEAASIGVALKQTDVAMRCNLVTLSQDEPYAAKTMVDYCADDISTEEAKILIEYIEEHLGSELYRFYSGVSYRHCLVIENGTTELGDMTPPHDISGRVITDYLSKNENAAPLLALMEKSFDLLKNHPVNIKRMEHGKRPANSIWLWGEGRKPELEDFYTKNGVKGGVVSAVDLLKGIGICSNMKVVDVPGATGYIDTNFEGKVQAAKRLFNEGCDLVYVHLEAPDECGHRGEIQNKVRSIELIDELVAAPLISFLKNDGEFRVLVMPDHPTPLSLKTHVSDPVPFFIFDSAKPQNGVKTFTENTAKETGIFIEHGPSIMDALLGRYSNSN